MDRLIKIAAGTSLLIYLSSYIIFALHLKLTGDKLNVMFALSMHLSVLISAAVFYFKIESPRVKAIAVYTVMFCAITIISYIVYGLIHGESYFFSKFALITSIPLTLSYAIVDYIIRAVRRRT